MKSLAIKIFKHWKKIYLICTFAYMVWIIQVADIEFDRINSQYRDLTARLEPAMISRAAVEELTRECLKQVKDRSVPGDYSCSDWDPAVLQEKEGEIKERRLRARERGFKKVVLFYMGYSLIFLVGPPLLIYLLLAGVVRIYKSIRFVW